MCVHPAETRGEIMANQLIVGIFPSSDVAELEKALAGLAGIEQDRLQVYTAQGKTQAHQDSFLNFTHVEGGASEEISPEMTHGTGLLTDFGGTDVPGVTDSREQSLEDFAEHEAAPNYLGSLPIPSDEIDNYNEAIDEGRTVVAYKAPSDGGQLRQSFRAAGLRNVEVFQLKG
jgi:hypothetical protein